MRKFRKNYVVLPLPTSRRRQKNLILERWAITSRPRIVETHPKPLQQVPRSPVTCSLLILLKIFLRNGREHQAALSAEMEFALKTVPPKLHTGGPLHAIIQGNFANDSQDIIVQHFLSHTNYHYYCLYPPTFTDSYSSWWAQRARGEAVEPVFTCLLLRTCACSIQYLSRDICEKLELELGETSQALTESCHLAARRICNTIPPGKGGVMQVQQLFLTSAWYKSEAMFVEAWHTLAAAIHEAQELGMLNYLTPAHNLKNLISDGSNMDNFRHA
jgi:hypothetical protein